MRMSYALEVRSPASFNAVCHSCQVFRLCTCIPIRVAICWKSINTTPLQLFTATALSWATVILPFYVCTDMYCKYKAFILRNKGVSRSLGKNLHLGEYKCSLLQNRYVMTIIHWITIQMQLQLIIPYPNIKEISNEVIMTSHSHWSRVWENEAMVKLT